jgi:hypothetical protein
MGFKKGENTDRTGKPNKARKVNQDFWQMILDKQADRIETALDKLYKKSPGYYLSVIIDMTEFVMPKMSRMEIKAEHEGKFELPPIIFKHEPVSTEAASSTDPAQH